MIFGRKKDDYSNRNTEQKLKKPEEPKEERVAGSRAIDDFYEKKAEKAFVELRNPFSARGLSFVPGYTNNGQIQRTIISDRDPIGRDKLEIGQFWLNKTERKLWILADYEHGEGVWIWI